jgi:hypothetical protein
MKKNFKKLTYETLHFLNQIQMSKIRGGDVPGDHKPGVGGKDR